MPTSHVRFADIYLWTGWRLICTTASRVAEWTNSGCRRPRFPGLTTSLRTDLRSVRLHEVRKKLIEVALPLEAIDIASGAGEVHPARAPQPFPLRAVAIQSDDHLSEITRYKVKRSNRQRHYLLRPARTRAR